MKKTQKKNWRNDLIEAYIRCLSDSKHKLVESLYKEELNKLKEQADRAFDYSEGSNCIVFSRSREMAMETLELLKEHLAAKYCNEDGVRIVPVTINPMLVKNDEQMFGHIFKSLEDGGMTIKEMKRYNSHDFWDSLAGNDRCGILIILEELEAHVHGTKQGLLYKLFDMLHYGPIKLFFVAVSECITIVDSFEKRIKSRYSHRYFSPVGYRSVDRSCSTRSISTLSSA